MRMLYHGTPLSFAKSIAKSGALMSPFLIRYDQLISLGDDPKDAKKQAEKSMKRLYPGERLRSTTLSAVLDRPNLACTYAFKQHDGRPLVIGFRADLEELDLDSESSLTQGGIVYIKNKVALPRIVEVYSKPAFFDYLRQIFDDRQLNLQNIDEIVRAP